MFVSSIAPIDLSAVNHQFFEGIQYGSTNRESMDIILPTDPVTPTGVVVYFHGGGFFQWDRKRAYTNGGDILGFLQAGIAYVTVDYDLVELVNEPTGFISAMNSAKRAIQFLKFNATDLNLDKAKFVLKGGSAGAGISAWLAYQPNLADPGSSDPVLREDTNILAVDLLRPQATYDTAKWESVVFASIPEWDLQAEYENIQASAEALHRTFGINSWAEFLAATSERQALDMLDFIASTNGVPTFINSPDTLFTSVVNFSIPDASHSPYHGQALKDALDLQSTENVCYLNGLFTDPSGETSFDFIVRKINE